MPAGELAQVREERVPAGLRRFVSELGGPSFKEAAVTGANAGKVPGQGRAGAPVWALGGGRRLMPSPPRHPGTARAVLEPGRQREEAH